MSRAGSAQPASPTMRAGTPATVLLCGTGASTTEPAATRAQWPISMLPENLGPGPDQHAMADFGMAIAGFLARAAKRHPLQDRNVVLDHGRLADDEARRVIQEYALADARGRD